ncbi:cytochrome D1 domain-containing protein [Roseovarius sp. 2305UL8-3]|uniref:cytochrome D1 domain-containing protein n=1 Tax=Roseovarius conchicola TaxID=3121636 RepID=UPI003528EFB3
MTRNTSFSNLRRLAKLTLTAFVISIGCAHADPAQIYAENCAECHGPNRLGAQGPALIPQTLKRMRGPKVANVILHGRVATQMPAYADILDPAAVDELAAWLKTPLETIPGWEVDQINASLAMNPDYVAVDAPKWASDPMNITLAVETGDHHVSVLDGDTFEVLDRFATPFAVHGGPKFSPDGRYVFIMSRDGWVQKYDIWALQEVGRLRAGLNSRNIAMSHDGKWLAVANYLPMTLTILSTDDLSVADVIPVLAKDDVPSRVSAVYQAPQRESFVLALKDAPEIWEVAAAPDGFSTRRIEVGEPIDDFFFDDEYRNLIGAARDGVRGIVVNLDQGQVIAELPLDGLPHLGSGISWERDGRRVMATPHLKEGKLSVIDTETWERITTIKTEGPGFFLRSHENTPYIWSDVFFGPNKDLMHVIDKQSFEIVKTLQPVPGATVAHVEFTRDGKHALVSVWEDDGAVIIYDAATFEEVRRLPMRKPSGKYNVWNKITFSEGTSH